MRGFRGCSEGLLSGAAGGAVSAVRGFRGYSEMLKGCSQGLQGVQSGASGGTAAHTQDSGCTHLKTLAAHT